VLVGEQDVADFHQIAEQLQRQIHGARHAVIPHATHLPSLEHAGFRQTLLDVFVPRYGAAWETFLDAGPVYARIDADRMFTFHMADGS